MPGNKNRNNLELVLATRVEELQHIKNTYSIRQPGECAMPFYASLIAFVCGLMSFAGTCHGAAPHEFKEPMSGSISLIKDSDDVKVHVSKSTTLYFEENEKLFVYQDGISVATLRVTKSYGGTCVATIESRVDDVEIKDWDRATLDTTINLALALSPDSDIDAIDLAAKHARADLEIGLKRILYYGQPEAEEAKTDLESDLPLHATVGCCVSEPLVAFVDEYNRIMRQEVSERATDQDKD